MNTPPNLSPQQSGEDIHYHQALSSNSSQSGGEVTTYQPYVDDTLQQSKSRWDFQELETALPPNRADQYQHHLADQPPLDCKYEIARQQESPTARQNRRTAAEQTYQGEQQAFGQRSPFYYDRAQAGEYQGKFDDPTFASGQNLTTTDERAYLRRQQASGYTTPPYSSGRQTEGDQREFERTEFVPQQHQIAQDIGWNGRARNSMQRSPKDHSRRGGNLYQQPPSPNQLLTREDTADLYPYGTDHQGAYRKKLPSHSQGAQDGAGIPYHDHNYKEAVPNSRGSQPSVFERQYERINPRPSEVPYPQPDSRFYSTTREHWQDDFSTAQGGITQQQQTQVPSPEPRLDQWDSRRELHQREFDAAETTYFQPERTVQDQREFAKPHDSSHLQPQAVVPQYSYEREQPFSRQHAKAAEQLISGHFDVSQQPPAKVWDQETLAPALEIIIESWEGAYENRGSNEFTEEYLRSFLDTIKTKRSANDEFFRDKRNQALSFRISNLMQCIKDEIKEISRVKEPEEEKQDILQRKDEALVEELLQHQCLSKRHERVELLHQCRSDIKASISATATKEKPDIHAEQFRALFEAVIAGDLEKEEIRSQALGAFGWIAELAEIKTDFDLKYVNGKAKLIYRGIILNIIRRTPVEFAREFKSFDEKVNKQRSKSTVDLAHFYGNRVNATFTELGVDNLLPISESTTELASKPKISEVIKRLKEYGEKLRVGQITGEVFFDGTFAKYINDNCGGFDLVLLNLEIKRTTDGIDLLLGGESTDFTTLIRSCADTYVNS